LPVGVQPSRLDFPTLGPFVFSLKVDLGFASFSFVLCYMTIGLNGEKAEAFA